ncbi:hypothetical protein NZK35_06360 [Stieleria sp. ICT_E10.1]|uniref:hypothetical protein n=1 Tax=Stieleria sedimenti TaxID=2976331 RepID=UPI00217FA754|nr:hypothetical protein [Stieleria sedimenti]MCS7466297.1 hypothetical protein [Stieleria sedimenti]
MTGKQDKSENRATTNYRGLSKVASYRFSPEVALELEVYGVARRFGSQRDIIERSLEEFFLRNPLPEKLRLAAITVLEGGE